MNPIKYFLILLFLSTVIITGQEIDIVPELKMIEEGKIDEAQESLASLLSSSPNDPSVIFLDGVLTEEGESALEKFEAVYNNFPSSRYADAALYRIFSFYYALGIYNRAEDYLDKLKSEYPKSPYIKAADRTIPDEDASIITDTKPTIEQTVKQSGNFTVQAGAFLNMNNAQKLQENLQSSGYLVEIFPKEVGGSILNVVTVGRFENPEEAQSLIQYLKSTYDLNGRIIALPE
ncbi:MAG: SPOR domain-containing protein [Melioribacteraceae bacterium]|nr:SPOR domain-containing protein [Melioribacteraceae bacterium]MDD3559637.1 SPOR domain-containing protein [Melioribacteraceae bacterium]